MTIEERIKGQLGELVFQLNIAQQRIDDQQAEIKQLMGTKLNKDNGLPNA
jgi:hypothetical protein